MRTLTFLGHHRAVPVVQLRQRVPQRRVLFLELAERNARTASKTTAGTAIKSGGTAERFCARTCTSKLGSAGEEASAERPGCAPPPMRVCKPSGGGG